ncbi:MAG: DJ-1/PfpI family protein [Armatimonadetes bacterium]|nr:DJ-1/PfpI family protein [Armatimonadota bacterium]
MTAGVLIFDQAEELDLVGPWEMLTMWKQVAGGPECLIVAEKVGPVTCAKGLTLLPHASFDDCPTLDLLVVPGGRGTRREVHNPAILDFIRQRAEGCQLALSVCTGAFLLQAAGLLDGKRATTHWESLDRLRALPGVEVLEERFTVDGKIWTSAGVSAGIDMTLAAIAHLAGDEVAGKVQLHAEYFPSDARYGGESVAAYLPRYARQGD